ncbi:hypothetical protein EYF80_020637 [Liparis tanakae]|uniref:Uncharacterized protein n=1 Tax=Liparis tanakae TaxID=230148 RepID=A0A4Z2HU45_9TELE|nr:hypothetical protein EYF80_020637 [Liparis tanakae]
MENAPKKQKKTMSDEAKKRKREADRARDRTRPCVPSQQLSVEEGTCRAADEIADTGVPVLPNLEPPSAFDWRGLSKHGPCRMGSEC